MSKFAEVLNNIGNNVLTEETKTAIVQAFEAAVAQRVDERVKIDVEASMKQLDEQHSQQLQKLLETIDADHTAKLQKVVAKIDEGYAQKLQEVIGKYDTLIKEEATGFRNSLQKDISNYLDLYLDKMVPAQQIKEACENTRALKIVDEIKKLVSVDEEFINDNIKEALVDGKNTIETLKQELNESIKENVKLNQSLKTVKANLIVEQKTKHMPDKKKGFVMRVLKDKSPEYIEENFNYVVEMFEKEDKDQAALITEQAKKETVTSNVHPPKSEIPQGFDAQLDNTPMKGYISQLETLDR